MIAMLDLFQNIHHGFNKIALEFTFDTIKADDLNVKRISDHTGQAIPKGVPIASVIIGEIKRLFDDCVKFKKVICVGKIKGV